MRSSAFPPCTKINERNRATRTTRKNSYSSLRIFFWEYVLTHQLTYFVATASGEISYLNQPLIFFFSIVALVATAAYLSCRPEATPE